MTKTTCAVCNIEFEMPDSLWEKRKEDGKEFFCPNGHSLVVTSSTNDKLRKEVRRLKDSVSEKNGYINRLRRSRDSISRSLSATKGVVTKLRKKLTE